LPPSCKRENWSRLGKRLEISSTGPGGDFESRAANGSLAIPLIGEGLGLGVCPCALAVGLPLLIGTTSGIIVCCVGGGENTAPTVVGGEPCISGDGNC